MQKYEYAEQVKDKLIKLLSMNPECKAILFRRSIYHS
jgi:hypothetical protein